MNDKVVNYFSEKNDELVHAWSEAGGDAGNPPEYQGPSGSLARMVFKGVDFFEKRTVLDMGCNSGLNSLAVAFLASKVIGCDRSEIYINRAEAGKKVVAADRNMDHLEFHVGDFSEFLTDEVDGIMACRILYHIGDDGVEQLSSFLKGKEHFRILVHTRPGRKKARTEVFNGLIEMVDIREFLSGLGFGNFKEWGGPKQRVLLAEK